MSKTRLNDSNDYKTIKIFAQEETLCIGSMGYYYPATCAIGKSGTLYFKHDYEDIVHSFSSMYESIEYELRLNQDLSSVSTQQDLSK